MHARNSLHNGARYFFNIEAAARVFHKEPKKVRASLARNIASKSQRSAGTDAMKRTSEKKVPGFVRGYMDL